MYSHAPENYNCPFCLIAAGVERPDISVQDDVVYRDDHVTALISLDWFPNNPGNVIIIPNRHVSTMSQRAARTFGTSIYMSFHVTIMIIFTILLIADGEQLPKSAVPTPKN